MTTNESTEPSVPSDGEIYSRASFPNEDYRQGFLEGLRTLAALALAPAPAAELVKQAFLEGAADGREAMRLSVPWDIEETWARSNAREALRAAQVRGSGS